MYIYIHLYVYTHVYTYFEDYGVRSHVCFYNFDEKMMENEGSTGGHTWPLWGVYIYIYVHMGVPPHIVR